VVLVAACGGRSTTFLLGSAANADAQNASMSTAVPHRTGQPHARLNLLPVFMP